MAAALISTTFVGGVAPHLGKTGRGLKCQVYSLTKVTANDWVELTDFSVISYAHAVCVDALNGNKETAETIKINTTTPYRITLASAYAATPVKIIAWGY